MEFQAVFEIFAVDRFDPDGDGVDGLIASIGEEELDAEFDSGEFPFGADAHAAAGEIATLGPLDAAPFFTIEDFKDGDADGAAVNESGERAAVRLVFIHVKSGERGEAARGGIVRSYRTVQFSGCLYHEVNFRVFWDRATHRHGIRSHFSQASDDGC